MVKNTLSECESVLIKKGNEYHRNDNPLHNFEYGSLIVGKTREEVIQGFALKHLISVLDIVNDISKDKNPSKEITDEKIGDLINYLLLLKFSIYKRIKKEVPEEDEQRMKIIAQNGNTGEHYEEI